MLIYKSKHNFFFSFTVVNSYDNMASYDSANIGEKTNKTKDK